MSLDSTIAHYVARFKKLRTNRNAGWPASALARSPYKPLLLLAVLDLFAQGLVPSNLVRLTPDLGELFNLYCARILPPDSRCNLAMPFFHMTGEGFWHLVPLPGKESLVAAGRPLHSVNQLADHIEGARLDEALYSLVCVENYRELLRAVLIETYFATEARPRLLEQGLINAEAFDYSRLLLRQAQEAPIVKELQLAAEEYRPAVRDQGFRRAVVTAYDHRCALCGIRMLTPEGHTAVVGAHIIPWSISRNDDPRNGVSLCSLCHWTFDEGLIGISLNYAVITSARLTAAPNVPGHLTTLTGRGIIGPQDKALWPDAASLKWHLKEKFLNY